MIQRIRRANRKGRNSTFVFFISKWSKIKNPAEIKKHQLKKSKNPSISAARTENTQFSNSNCPKALKTSSLSQVLNVDNEKNISDSESLLESKVNLDNVNNKDLIATFLAMNTENSCKKAKKDKQTSRTNKKKQVNFTDKIFDYIYVVQCY